MKKYFFGYIALTTALFWETLSGAVIVRRDLLIITYPFKWLAAQIWRSGQLPLWNSAGGSGMPLLADPVTGAFDPFLPLFMLPLGVAQCGTIYLWIKYLLAGVSMHRYLRVTGMAHSAAFLGGSVFMLSGFSIGSWTLLNWVSALMFLPLVMTVPHVRGTPRGRGISAAVILSLSFWSGAIEPTLFMAAFWIAECIAHPHQGRGAEVAIGLLGFIALSLFQFLPTFEMYRLSDRQGGLNLLEVFATSISPFQLIGLVIPITFIPPDGGRSFALQFELSNPLFFGTYLGAALLPLALLAAHARRFALFAVIGGVLAMGRYLPGAVSLLESWPAFAILRHPAKFLFFLPPSLAILGASGWSEIETARTGRRAAAAIGAGLLIIAVFSAGTLWPDPFLPSNVASLMWRSHLRELIPAAQHALVAFSAAALLIATLEPSKKWMRSILLIVIVADLFIAARGSLKHGFEPPSVDHTPALRRAISEPWPRIFTSKSPEPTGSGTWEAHQSMTTNSGIPYAVRHAEEYSAFRIASFNTWFSRHIRDKNADVQNFAAAGINWYVAHDQNVSQALDKGWKKAAADPPFVLLENPFRMNDVRLYPDRMMPTHAELRMPGEPVISSHEKNGDVQAVVTGAGWLYRAENFYPGWNAYADGKEVPIFSPKDFFGQMVFLDAPAVVTFHYRPVLFSIGLGASFMAMLCCSGALIRR